MEQVSIDRYSDFEAIGEGGFSSVYRAWQPEFRRHVAVKVLTLDPDRTIDSDQFEAECQATGTLSTHPHVVTVYDNGFTNEDFPFIVMELCQESLLQKMNRAPNKQLPLDVVLDVGVKILDALEVAHGQGIHHRDVKPQNILFTEYGHPVLADFGIASIDGAQTSEAMSRHYAAPEIINNGRYTASCDIYSLGATLYTALAGRRPFWVKGKNSPSELEERIRFEPPPPLNRVDIPNEVETSLFRLLSKHAHERPATAAKAAALLHDIVDRSAGPRLDEQLLLRGDETEATITGSPQQTAAPAPSETDTPFDEVHVPEQSRRSILAGLGLFVVLIAGAIALVLAVRTGDGDTNPTPTSSPRVAPTTVVVPIPDVPSGIVVEVVDGTAMIRWDAVPGAEQYRVLSNIGETLIVQEASATIEKVAADTTVCAAVAAANGFGRESDQSSLVCSE